ARGEARQVALAAGGVGTPEREAAVGVDPDGGVLVAVEGEEKTEFDGARVVVAELERGAAAWIEGFSTRGGVVARTACLFEPDRLAGEVEQVQAPHDAAVVLEEGDVSDVCRRRRSRSQAVAAASQVTGLVVFGAGEGFGLAVCSGVADSRFWGWRPGASCSS